MERALWIGFGGLTQVLFIIAVLQLFAFLYADSGDLLGIEPIPGALTGRRLGRQTNRVVSGLVLDLALLVQFGVSHSLFLYPAVRWKLERFIPRELYGSCYSMAASASLMLTAAFWQPLPGVVYQTGGILAWMLLAAFLTSWGALFYSLHLSGLGFQTGFTTWWFYVRKRQVPQRPFVIKGAYRFLRHPIYLSFLGILWFTPRMSTDHFLAASVWTVYVFVGSVLKDRRLLFFLGNTYREYMAKVPGYPWIPRGRLARVPLSSSPADEHEGVVTRE